MELIAYCFMPDHVHLLVSGRSEDADLGRFVGRWKQLTGYHYRRKTGERLWQESYHDHVLRDDEETWRAMRYILENPVRRGLAMNFEDYPHSGSDAYTFDELRALWWTRQG